MEPCKDEIYAWRNCQRCGRPHCAACAGEAIAKNSAEAGDTAALLNLKRCGVALPLTLCLECRGALRKIDDAIPERVDPTVRCAAHAADGAAAAAVGGGAGGGRVSSSSSSSSSAPAACAACTAAGEAHRRLLIDSALSALAATMWHGAGGRRTNAAKAGAAAMFAVPMLAINTVGGVLGGLASGALSGAAGGFIFAGAAGLDAGNAMYGNKAGGKSAKAAAAAAANAAATASLPPPSEKIPAMMAHAKKVMKMGPEEQEKDAVAECARVAACKNAYEVLEIPATATKEEVTKAHRAKSMAYHPDKNGAAKAKDAAQAANNAYSLLSDPEKRAKYDASGFSDTSGVDLSEGVNVEIGMSRGSMAAGAVSGFLGGLAGFGLGAAAGVVGGALTGVVGTVARAREYSLDTISAGEIVGERIAARRAQLKREEDRSGPGPAGMWGAGGAPLKVEVEKAGPAVTLRLSVPRAGLGAAAAAAAAARAARSSGGSAAEAGPSTALTTTAGAGSAASVLALTGSASNSASPGSLPPPDALALSAFTLPELQGGLELVVGPRFLDRYARSAGGSDGDREFARKYAASMGAVAAFQRKHLGVPEPKAESGDDDGSGGGGSGGGDGGPGRSPDATGMNGGDMYEDRHGPGGSKEATTISSAGKLLSHMSSELGKEMDGARGAAEAQMWALLAARYEAYSRGRVPDEGWLDARVRGILGEEDEEEAGGESGSPTAAAAAAAARAARGSGGKKPKRKAVTDPDQGWDAVAATAVANGATSIPAPVAAAAAKAARAMAAAAIAAPVGPFLIVDVAVVQQHGVAPSAAAGGGAAAGARQQHAGGAGGAGGAPAPDPGCGPWRTLSCAPLAAQAAKRRAGGGAGEGAATAEAGEEADASLEVLVRSLPLSLLADVPGGAAGGGGGGGGGPVRLRVRTYLSPRPAKTEEEREKEEEAAAAAGGGGGGVVVGVARSPPQPAVYAARVAEIEVPREALAAAAGSK